MTISSEVRKAGPFDGNDVADTFPFTFKVFTTADVLVVRADALGVETELDLGTDYTVSLNANQETSPGGDVILAAPLPTGEKLVVTSQVGNLQPVDLTNQGGFFPSVINAALDRLTIQIQQLAERLDRSAKLPITQTGDVDDLLADIVLLADNIAALNTLVSNLASINAVAAIDTDVTTVAGVAAGVPVVAGVAADVTAVAAIAADVTALAAQLAAVVAVAAQIANVALVAAIDGEVAAVAAIDADVVAVAAAIADIQAAVADLPALAAKASLTGATFTGPVEVPAGGSGAQVPQAQEVVALSRGQNRLLNPRFNINNLAVSGTVVLAAGAYGHDGWKAGAGGCTYTFATSAGVTTLTISAGTLVQTIEGAELESGTHVLSWTGTAQGRIASGSYGASGITASITGGVNTDIEFGTGTLAKPQFEEGSVPKPFQHRGIPWERMLCNRHCCILYWGHTVGNATGAQTFGNSVSWPTLMYATPTVTDLGGGTVVNAATVTIDTATTEGARVFFTTTGAGAATVHNRRIRAEARL